MNAEINTPMARKGNRATLAASGFGGLAELRARFAEIETALQRLDQIGDAGMAQPIGRVRAKLQAFEPSVTMIGQVKAGKTSLVNAMVGWPDLLPADVNPWTSVVTSLHLDPFRGADQQAASFRFFSQQEWDRLVVNGGRIGELAGRAGAGAEVDKVRRQIAEMREKSRRRLGRKFELLLGQTHEYASLDEELVERYVCLGDDFEDDTETSNARGRFADITKSAGLFISRPEMPMRLCLRDTPGVNDTFMVREQITLRAIRDSRICVVVLSAHQALSAVDMALIRMITNVEARQVIIFVNRIDELQDPVRQVAEIGDSIRATLAAHNGPEEVQILFGSAYWAGQTMCDGGLAPDSAEALQAWAAAKAPSDAGAAPQGWALSGVPELCDAIARRIAEGPGEEMAAAATRELRNLTNGMKATARAAPLRLAAGRPDIDPAEVKTALARIAAEGRATLAQELETLLGDLETRLGRSHQSFLQRATAALIEHLERWGDDSVWKYDPAGLRVLFRSAYQLFAKRSHDKSRAAFDQAACNITQLYWQFKLVDDSAFAIEPPEPPQAPAPVMLGQTIALDLQGNWWSRWWRRRRGYEAFAKEFHDLIEAETQPIVNDLMHEHAVLLGRDTVQALQEFVEDQAGVLLGALGQPGTGAPASGPNPEAQQRRQSALQDIIDDLEPARSKGAQ